MFVAQESDRGRLLSLDQLLIIQHLLRHPEIDTATATRVTQQGESEAREVLTHMESNLASWIVAERGGGHIGFCAMTSIATFRPPDTRSGIGALTGRQARPGFSVS